MINIFVNSKIENINIKINELASIYSLKDDISKKINIDKNSFFIKCKTKVIDENQTLKYYNIKNNDTLHLIEKNEGGKTASDIIKILLAVFLSFFIFFVILLGLFPLLSYTLSAFIKVIFKNLGAFINKISNVNQILSKIIKSNFFKFISKMFMVILDFFSLTIFTYVITMGCSYFAFNLKAKNNFCKGFKNNKKLALIVTIAFVIQYFLFNFPMYIIKLFELIAFGKVTSIILAPIFTVLKKLNDAVRRLVLMMIPFLGTMLGSYLGMTIVMFHGFKSFQIINSAILFKLCNVLPMIMNSPESKAMIDDFKLTPIIDMMMYTNNCNNARKVSDLDKGMIRASYFVDWLYKNILYSLFLIGDILNKTCESEEMSNAESEVDETKASISKLIKKIGAERINPDSNRGKDIFKNIDRLAEVLQKKISKKNDIQKNQTINPTCMQDFVGGGVFAAPLTLLIWLIAFIVLIVKT